MSEKMMSPANTDRNEFISKVIFVGVILLMAGITCVASEGFSRQVFYLFIAFPAFLVFLKSVLGRARGRLFTGGEASFALLILFLIYCFASLFWSELDLTGRADVGRRFYYVLLFALAIFMLAQHAVLLRGVLYGFVLLTTLSLMLAMLAWSEDVHRLEGAGRLRIETHAAGFYCSASVLATYFALIAGKRSMFFLWGLLALFLLFGNVLTVSRVPMAVNLLFVSALLVHRFRTNIPALLASLTVVVALLVVSLAFVFPEKLDVIYQKSLHSLRYRIWSEGFRLFLQHPFFGIGLGNAEDIVIDWGRVQFSYHPHNLLLAYGIKLGLVGLVWLVMLLVVAILRGSRRRDLYPWCLMLAVYCFLSLASGRVVLDRIQPEWVLFYLPWFVLLSVPLREHNLRLN